MGGPALPLTVLRRVKPSPSKGSRYNLAHPIASRGKSSLDRTQKGQKVLDIGHIGRPRGLQGKPKPGKGGGQVAEMARVPSVPRPAMRFQALGAHN